MILTSFSREGDMKLDVASSFNPSSPSDQNIFRSNLIKLIHLNWLISLIAVYTI